MRILLSTIGSRGDVQPLVALALELKARGHSPRLCVPPDFYSWLETLGLPATPIGPELRPTGKVSPFHTPPTPEQRRKLTEETVAAQFKTITEAAQGCDLIVGATALQIAAPSIAEHMGIPYVFAAYCPAVLPSAHHAPPVYFPQRGAAAPPPSEFPALWAQDAQRFNDLFGPPLNAHRASLGLPPVEDVRSHVFTPRPWLAADATLGPWPEPHDNAVFQTGAWIISDDRPLDPEIERFLDAGEPPVYFGFGSIRAPEELSRTMIGAARACRRRAIVLKGWADLALIDEAPDCLSIGEVNQQALFRRVAAVVHHGGAGTTHAAALGGAPQVLIPQHYDQPYWAKQIERLGIGAAHAAGTPTQESLTASLERAHSIEVRRDGALIAAKELEQLG